MNHQSRITNQYLFVLGRETELCAAELETVLAVTEPAATIQTLPSGVALVQRAPSVASSEVGPARSKPHGAKEGHREQATDVAAPLRSSDRGEGWWIKRLGGTRLIARCLGSIKQLTAEALLPFVNESTRELAISSSTVSARQRMKLLLQLKNLRSGFRYRPVDDAYLASGLSERLLRRSDGLELLLIPPPPFPLGKWKWLGGNSDRQSTDHEWLVAKVVAVQDTRAWTERDMGLPAPDPVVGMLPPKLARIMVNLAEPARRAGISSGVGTEEARSTLLDPFSGSGQIPIEAVRLGWPVTASDRDAAAIERTERNLTWAQHRFSIQPAGSNRENFRCFQSDVAELPVRLAGQAFDAIVTEPDLGPPLRSNTAVPSAGVLDGVTRTIRQAFEVGRTLLRSGGRLVIVVPIIAGQRIGDRLDGSVFSGYRRSASLHYARPDSRVEREIFVLDRM